MMIEEVFVSNFSRTILATIYYTFLVYKFCETTVGNELWSMLYVWYFFETCVFFIYIYTFRYAYISSTIRVESSDFIGLTYLYIILLTHPPAQL